MDLNQKIILVTGAGSGVGQKLAIDLEKKGAQLVLLDISEKGLKHTLSLLQDPNTVHYIFEVKDLGRWVQIFQEIIQKYKKVDILSNLVGYLSPGYVHEFSFEEIDKHIDMNV
ncbi:MAG: SDR family oxidoreductase [Leptospiraceae bacterium]|nr:SDR family oxidoreductase [Leptospiraceae bacterium]